MQLDVSAITEKGKATWKTIRQQWERVPRKIQIRLALCLLFLGMTLLLISRVRTGKVRLPAMPWRTGTPTPTSSAAPNGASASSSTIFTAATSDALTKLPGLKSEAIVIGEDDVQYILPSSFALRERSGDELNVELDRLDDRVSALEDMVAKRAIRGW